jgi:hypothetical protein
MIDPWLLIPCQGARTEMLWETLDSLQHPPERTVIVTTSEDPVRYGDIGTHTLELPYDGQRISSWWNAGIDYIRARCGDQLFFEIAVISSDVQGHPGSIEIMAETLRFHDLEMVGPNYHREAFSFFDRESSRTVHNRVPGACWMIKGESGLRLDEQFRWWYSDDDLEMQARQRGDVAIIPDTGFRPGPDSVLSPELQQWAREDRQKFIDKWGMEPW